MLRMKQAANNDMTEKTSELQDDAKKNKIQYWTKEIINLLLILLIVLAFKSIFIANYTVPTGSMERNILPGDKLIVNKMAFNLRIPFTDYVLYEFGLPKRGDVIVFDFPPDPSINFVKRVIGLPGEKVIVANGFVTVNGKDFATTIPNENEKWDILYRGGHYEEIIDSGLRYEVQRRPVNNGSDFEQEWTVPAGHYFVMGDNRDVSMDSRSWGFVPMKNVKGKALFIYFSTQSDEGAWLPNKFRFERIGLKL